MNSLKFLKTRFGIDMKSFKNKGFLETHFFIAVSYIFKFHLNLNFKGRRHIHC